MFLPPPPLSPPNSVRERLFSLSLMFPVFTDSVSISVGTACGGGGGGGFGALGFKPNVFLSLN